MVADKIATGIVVPFVRPSFFKIGGVAIQNWGSCLSAAFLLSAWIADIEFQRMGLDMDTCDLLLMAMVFGVLGSKLHCAISEIISGGPITPLFSGAGLSFQGGFLLATAVMTWYIKFYQKKSVGKALDSIAPGLVMGYAVGKIGCFLVGDGCYGMETKQPWGMHFPNALVPTKTFVHPVPLYEAFFNFGLLAFLMWRARDPKGIPVWNNLGTMFGCLGFLRFLIEYVRTNPIVFLGLTEYQWIAFGMIMFGVSLTTFSHTALCVRLSGPRHIPGKTEKKKKLDTVKETELAEKSPKKASPKRGKSPKKGKSPSPRKQSKKDL